MFFYGLVVGSFLNVLIYRMPREEPVTTPPSHCPACGARLRARDLFPLVSFLIQGCRCRYCKAPISWRYFGVELLTGVLFTLVIGARGFTLDSILVCLFVATLIATFFIDLEHYIIPDELNLAGVLIGVTRDALGGFTHDPSWALARIPIPFSGEVMHAPRSLMGAITCAALLYGIAWLGSVVFKKEAMGMGDVKLAAAFGANLTGGAVLIAFFVAVGLGAVIGLLLMATGLRGRDDMVPFGPFLVTGALVALFWGAPLFHWYLRQVGLAG